MRWRGVIAIFAVAGGSLACMVHIKTDVGLLVDQRHVLLKQQRILKETIKVQQAEWVHLTRPDRLERFARDMGLNDIDMVQILPLTGRHLGVKGDGV